MQTGVSCSIGSWEFCDGLRPTASLFLRSLKGFPLSLVARGRCPSGDQHLLLGTLQNMSSFVGCLIHPAPQDACTESMLFLVVFFFLFLRKTGVFLLFLSVLLYPIYALWVCSSDNVW